MSHDYDKATHLKSRSNDTRMLLDKVKLMKTLPYSLKGNSTFLVCNLDFNVSLSSFV